MEDKIYLCFPSFAHLKDLVFESRGCLNHPRLHLFTVPPYNLYNLSLVGVSYLIRMYWMNEEQISLSGVYHKNTRKLEFERKGNYRIVLII